MRKALLHVGTMKTGTTSIQKTLSANPDALDRLGLAFLGPPMRHSSALGPALSEIDHEKDLIISDEGLWHFADSKRSDTAGLARLLSNYQVTVIVYLRRPDSFINSWFQQGLKSGTGSRTMTQFLRSSFLDFGLRFQERIERFQGLFGEKSIVLRPYERCQLHKGDAVLDFLNLVGIEASTLRLRPPANTTEDADRLLLRSLFQSDRPRSPDLMPLLKELDQVLTTKGFQGQRYGLLSRSEITELVAVYKPVFTALQSTYGGGVAPAFFQDWPDPNDVDDSQLTLRWTQEKLFDLRG